MEFEISDSYSEYVERLRSQRAAIEAEETTKSDATGVDRLLSACQPIRELAKALLEAGEISRFIEPAGDSREVKAVLEGPGHKFAITVCCRDVRKSGPPQLSMNNTLFDLQPEIPPDLLFAIRGNAGVERRFEYTGSDMDLSPLLDHIIQCIVSASRRYGPVNPVIHVINQRFCC